MYYTLPSQKSLSFSVTHFPSKTTLELVSAIDYSTDNQPVFLVQLLSDPQQTKNIPKLSIKLQLLEVGR